VVNSRHNQLLFFLCSISLVLLNFYFGPSISSDTFTYLKWLTRLESVGFAFPVFHEDLNHSFVYIFYDFFLLYLWFIKFIFQESWQTGFFLLNQIYLGLCLFMLLKLSLKALDDLAVNIFLIALIFLSLDFFIWPRFILSEGLFLLLFTSCLYCYSKSFILKDNSKSFLPYIAACFFFLALFSKPGSIGVLSGLIFFHMISFLKPVYRDSIFKILIIIIIIIAPIIYEFIIDQILISDNYKTTQLISYAQSGFVVDGRPTTFLSDQSLATLYLYRFFYFFFPIVPELSILHKSLDLAFSIIFFLSLIIWGIFSSQYTRMFQDLCKLMLLVFTFSALFHSATLIDYDWRYRFPSLIPMILFIIYNFYEIRRIIHDRSSYSSIQN